RAGQELGSTEPLQQVGPREPLRHRIRGKPFSSVQLQMVEPGEPLVVAAVVAAVGAPAPDLAQGRDQMRYPLLAADSVPSLLFVPAWKKGSGTGPWRGAEQAVVKPWG